MRKNVIYKSLDHRVPINSSLFLTVSTLCNLFSRFGCVLVKVLLSGEIHSRKVMNFRTVSLRALSTPSGTIYPLKFRYALCSNADSYEVLYWRSSIIVAMCVQFLLATITLLFIIAVQMGAIHACSYYYLQELSFDFLFPIFYMRLSKTKLIKSTNAEFLYSITQMIFT